MKILFLTENYYRGGLDTFLIGLINHWPYSEDELFLTCNKSHPGLEIIRARLKRPCKIEVHELPSPVSWRRWVSRRRVLSGGLSGTILSLCGKALAYPFFLYNILGLVLKFRTQAYDRLLVVNGGYPGGMSCRAASIAWGVAGMRPLSIHNFHNFVDKAPWGRRWIENFVDTAVHHFSRAMVSVSGVCLASLRERVSFRKPGDYRVIYNGIESASIQCAKNIRVGLNIPQDSPLCLMLATYEPRKGHEFFLKAFSLVVDRLPNARALICGHGSQAEIEHVKGLVAFFGLEQHVLVEDYWQDVGALLKEAQVLVVPSQSYESFGLVIAEAMAMQRPVVATNIGGIPEVIQNGQGGFLVDPGDIDSFAAHIRMILENPELGAKLGALGFQQYAAKFTAARMASEYADLIRLGS